MSDEHDGVSKDEPSSGDEPSGGEAKATADAPAGRGTARKAPSLSKSEPVEDSVDPASSDADDAAEDSALTTPASPGSARAAARRAAARSGTSDKKGTATPKRGSTTAVKKPNVFARLGRFLREVVAELRKVIWPSRNQMVTYTIVVIVFVVFMVALVGVLDLLFAKGVFAVFG
ncbi:MAG TPA: preprotein translocase subunit SecE [Nakamurella sp.]